MKRYLHYAACLTVFCIACLIYALGMQDKFCVIVGFVGCLICLSCMYGMRRVQLEEKHKAEMNRKYLAKLAALEQNDRALERQKTWLEIEFYTERGDL